MPFLARIIQDSEKNSSLFLYALYIYEFRHVYLWRYLCYYCKTSLWGVRNYGVGGVKEQEEVIKTIIRELRTKKRVPNIQKEIRMVLKAGLKNANSQKSGEIADFYMKKKGKEFYFEIKTVKPNYRCL